MSGSLNEAQPILWTGGGGQRGGRCLRLGCAQETAGFLALVGIRHGHASASGDTWGTQHADHIPQGRWCQGNQKVAQGTGPRKPKARLPGRCHGEQRPPRKGGQRCSEPRGVEGASEGQADLVLSPPPGSDCRRTF